MPRDDAEAGFTLLEVLIAFALFTAVASALMAAFAVAVRGDRQAAFITRGTLIAQSLMAGVGAEGALSPGVSSGRLPDGTVWRTEIRPERVIPSGGPRPIAGYWVAVTVFDPAAARRRSVSLTGFEIDRGGAR